MKPIRILFANIGWMTHYQGINKSDQIQGGGAYNKMRINTKHTTLKSSTVIAMVMWNLLKTRI